MGTTSSSLNFGVENDEKVAPEHSRQVSTENTRKRIDKMDKTMKLLLYQKGATTRFNLKIVIRGDRKSGKSSLLRRLQGLNLLETYRATPEIESHVINWTYKNEYVKIDFWDTVDVGIASEGTSVESIGTVMDPDRLAGIPRNVNGLDATVKMALLSKGTHKVGLLDAQLVNPYLGAHGVIIIFDPCAENTREYVTSMFESAPKDMPVLLLSNFADLKSSKGKAETANENIKQLCNNVFKGDRIVHFLEASVKTGSGMKALYNYLRIPFLHFRKTETAALLKRLSEELKKAENDMCQVSDLNPTRNTVVESLLDGLEQQKQSKTPASHDSIESRTRIRKVKSKKNKTRSKEKLLGRGNAFEKTELYEFQSKDRQRLNAFLADVDSDGEDSELAARKRQQRERIEACIIES